MNLSLNRSGIVYLQNKSGGTLAFGDVGIIDDANAAAITTTTTANLAESLVVVVLDPNGIAIDGVGLCAYSGYVPQINLSASASLGDFVATGTTIKKGTPHALPIAKGDFAQVLGTGISPAAILFPNPYFSEGRVLLASASPTAVGTVSFPSIPQIYKKLTIEFALRSTQATPYVGLYVTLNEDTTDSNYRKIYFSAFGTGGGATSVSAAASRVIFEGISGANAPSNAFTIGKIELIEYSSGDFNKIAQLTASERRDSSSGYLVNYSASLNWANVDPITRIDLDLSAGNFETGSVIRVYGEY